MGGPGPSVPGPADPGTPGRSRAGSSWTELPVLALVAVVVAVLLRALVLQAFSIPSGSMERTLVEGDRIVVEKVSGRSRHPERGDVVVFEGRGTFLGDPVEQDYVKRVIGIAGDRVACCDEGRVTVQRAGSDVAVPLEEPYVFEDDSRVFCEAGTGSQCPPGSPGVLVPEGRLWVMGDHRSRSGDSRVNRRDGDGTIGTDQVVGRAVAVLWPPSRLALLPSE